MKNIKHGLILISAAFFGLNLFSTVALAISIPPNDGYVTDAAGILSKEDEATLEESLKAYKDMTSNEIAIVIVPSLEGDAIEDAGLQIARTWQVGSTKNNGILILVAYAEREVRIDVGYGLEGAVPDIVAKGIIDADMVPAFRDAAYGTGLVSAVDSLKKHIGGEYTAERYTVEPDAPFFTPVAFFLIFILFQWGLAILGRSKSWWLGGVLGGIGGVVLTIAFAWWLSIPFLIFLGLFLDFIVSKNYKSRGKTRWWAGGGGFGGGGSSGSSGGGFGGFGGGSFGGGGASGRW